MITVTAAILFKDNKIFLARRNSEIKYAGKWEFPGGKMEQDENAEQCLSREIKDLPTLSRKNPLQNAPLCFSLSCRAERRSSMVNP